MLRTAFPCLLLVWLVLTLASCDGRERPVVVDMTRPAPAVAARGSPAVRFAIPLALASDEGYPIREALASYLTRHAGIRVEPVERRTQQEVIELLRQGRVSFAGLTTGAYVLATEDFPLEVVAVPRIRGRLDTTSLLIAPAGAPEASLADLKGKRIAFTDPASCTGHLCIGRDLRALGENPDLFFRLTLFTYDHDGELHAVQDRIVDAAAVDEHAFEREVESGRFARQDFKILARSRPVPVPPIVAVDGVDPSLLAEVRRVLLDMHRHPEGQGVLRLLGVERFEDAPPGMYDEVRGEIRQAGGGK